MHSLVTIHYGAACVSLCHGMPSTFHLLLPTFSLLCSPHHHCPDLLPALGLGRQKGGMLFMGEGGPALALPPGLGSVGNLQESM